MAAKIDGWINNDDGVNADDAAGNQGGGGGRAQNKIMERKRSK